MQQNPSSSVISVLKEGVMQKVPISQLGCITGAPYMPTLDFVDFCTLRTIVRKTTTARKKSSRERFREWLAAYFQKEVLEHYVPDVSLRWIDDKIGWGVFTERDFQSMEFIAEYSGTVRKRRKRDRKNAYCFEYLLDFNQSTPYLIDAMERGGISRYINHSFQPNLDTTSVHIAGVNHIILFTTVKIPKNTQLLYNYGPDYWTSRGTPLILT